MSLIKERKVENIELFYDLIFTYAISKISELAHHPHNGIIEPWILISFILYSLAVLQEWSYLTYYLNRFGTFNIKEIVIICINMGAAIYLSNSLSLDWEQIFYPFSISMLIMSSSVAFLYHCQAMKKSVGERESINARNILLIVITLFAMCLLLGFRVGILFCIAANISGVFLPMIHRVKFSNGTNFGHLKERFELLTILFFGEMVVTIAQYFSPEYFTIYPFIAFITMFFLFGTYTVLINKAINPNQKTRGFILIYSHFFLLMSLEIIIYCWNLVGKNADKTFLAIFYIVGYTGFYLMLFVNEIYLEKKMRLCKEDFFKIFGVMIFSFAVIFIFRENFIAGELSILFMTFSILLIVSRKYIK